MRLGGKAAINPDADLLLSHNLFVAYLIYCSVAQLCPALYDPMDCSTPDFPVLHHLLEFAQTHVHWVGDAIQLSHPLSFPSPAFNLAQLHLMFFAFLIRSILYFFNPEKNHLDCFSK